METEVVPNTFPALFQGYTVIWALIVVYAASLGVRLRRIERKLQETARSGDPAAQR